MNKFSKISMVFIRRILSAQLQGWFSLAVCMPVSICILVSAAAAEPETGERLDSVYVYNEYVYNDYTQTAESIVSESPDSNFLMNLQLAQTIDDENDPFEEFNRSMFAFNEVFYDAVMRPVSGAYNILPISIRRMISSFLANLGAPVIFINDLLQGELPRAMTTAQRFVINSTIGLGGIVDIASSAGLEEHDEDFGQTLAVWGVDEGFYLVLPILGPGNPRDAIGRFLVDPFIDPFNRQLDDTGNEDWIYGRFALSAVDQFALVADELEQTKKTSIDYYAAIRSLYRQKRKAEIANGDEFDLPAIPDFEFSDLPDFKSPDPTVGRNGSEGKKIEDQVSLINFKSRDEVNFFRSSSSKQPASSTHEQELSSSWDVITLAPRKPKQFIRVDTKAREWPSEDSTLIAELSWDSVNYSSVVSR